MAQIKRRCRWCNRIYKTTHYRGFNIESDTFAGCCLDESCVAQEKKRPASERSKAIYPDPQ